jgi:hypothetical protein
MQRPHLVDGLITLRLELIAAARVQTQALAVEYAYSSSMRRKPTLRPPKAEGEETAMRATMYVQSCTRRAVAKLCNCILSGIVSGLLTIALPYMYIYRALYGSGAGP